MKEYKEIVLGAAALKYIRGHLTHGLTLSKYILEYLDLETGQCATALPEEANLEKINDFESGWIIPPPPESKWHRLTPEDGVPSILIPVNTLHSYLFDTIRSFLEASPEHICISENAAAHPSAPWLQRRKSHIVTFQKEVYTFLLGGQRSNDEIKVAIYGAETAWHLIGAMTSLPDDKYILSDGQKINSDILKTLAARTEKIFVSAYDGEAYIIWHNKSI
ncbi:MAG: hypothetical protein JSV54_03235 [Chloroflexota bacterium]|nr:MAG: hypothetical protein JSV54_03235 [Chloroflexota bacterium]